MFRNTPNQLISFGLVSSADGETPIVAGSPEVWVTVGLSQAGGAGVITHRGNGVWEYVPTAAETDGAHVSFTCILAGAITVNHQVYTTGTVITGNVIDTTSGNVNRVALVDLTTQNADMRGTDGANQIEPATPADVLAVITRGDIAWTTAMGFATPTDVTDTETAIIAAGDARWATATGFLTTGVNYRHTQNASNDTNKTADVTIEVAP